MFSVSQNSNLAVEALAGLASKEDFTSVKLRKAETNRFKSRPYHDLMLIQIKGRRHVQTRLVEPTVGSVNSGDTYILVTPKDVRTILTWEWLKNLTKISDSAIGVEYSM